MPGRSEWGESLHQEGLRLRKRRWRIEISEHDRMMIIMKLERLTPSERSPTEKALLEFMDSLPSRLNGDDPKKLIKKPLRKGRKLANRPHNRKKTAAETAKLMDAHARRVAAAERKKARMDQKKKTEKKATSSSKRKPAAKKATSSKKGSVKKVVR